MDKLSESEWQQLVEAAAEQAADRAVEKMTDKGYRELGVLTLRGLTYAAGVAASVLILYAASKGWIKLS